MIRKRYGRRWFFLTNGEYNLYKVFITIILPLFGVLYFLVGSYMGWPAVDTVCGVILTVIAFFGIVLSLSTKYYRQDKFYDGQILIEDDLESGKKMFNLELNYDPLELVEMDTVRFRVIRKG